MASVFQIVVLYACFVILGMIAAVCAFIGLKNVGDALRVRLCPVSLLMFAIAAGIATSEAQKRGGMQGGESTFLTLPNAVTNAAWRAHGAYEAAFYIPATNWWARMQDGGWIDRLRIFSSGGFQAKGADGGAWTNYPPPFAQKLSLAPEVHWPLLTDTASLFWYAWTDGLAYIDNPFGWHVKGTSGNTPPHKVFGEYIQDTIILDRQGRVGVWKLNNWVERSTNDVIHLYGPRTTEEE